jgi:type III restriction enzyme
MQGRIHARTEWVTKVAQHPKLADLRTSPGRRFHRYACKMATGSGKTVVMAMLLAWAFCNRGTKPGDPRFPAAGAGGLPEPDHQGAVDRAAPRRPGQLLREVRPRAHLAAPRTGEGRVLVTNWHWLAPEAEENRRWRAGRRLGPESDESFARSRSGRPVGRRAAAGAERRRPPCLPPGPGAGEDVKLTAEEKADREEATVWVSGLDKINAACGIGVLRGFVGHAVLHPGQRLSGRLALPVDRQRLLAGGCDRERHHQDSAPAGDGQHGPAGPKYFKLWEHITRDLKAGEKLNGGKPKPEVVYRKAEDALLTLGG